MTAPAAAASEVVSVEIPLARGWELASAWEPGADPARLPYIPAQVPGTVASALRARNAWKLGDGLRFDASDHWFRCRFEADPAGGGEELYLRFGGIATVSEVWLNGQSILKSESMFASHEVDVSALVQASNELLIVCRSLAAALAEKRGRSPKPRWRTRVVSEPQLRWFRTTLLGRAPGFSAEPEPAGPWRPITLVRRRRVIVESWSRQLGVEEETGTIAVQVRLRALDAGARPLSGRLVVGDTRTPLLWHGSGDLSYARAVLRIPNVVRWWPHTHGEPALYPVGIELRLADGSQIQFEDVPAGFRVLDSECPRPDDAGLALTVNQTPVFCRGVIWTPTDVVTLSSSPVVLRERLLRLREGGFNLIRLVGTTVYETEAFHRLCDELGLLVWQDLMFANMDYPFQDPEFRQTARAEAEFELSRLSRHASTAVICGNSEIEQQAGMLGLDAALGRESFFADDLPSLLTQCCAGVPYVPSVPCGGALPFHARCGIANYFGVGAYLRPLDDARRAGVRFAAECLAFANVPEAEMIESLAGAYRGGFSPVHPGWKRTIPRDAGAGWDFEDVRDHYLKLLYGVDAATLRYSDAARYWELSRMVSGEVMAAVFGEWRRPASLCRGGIILWAADLEAGGGWGILDAGGGPKAPYWFLKRALAPCAIWATDEGLNGVDLHVANDGPAPLEAQLRVALYQAGEHRIAGATLEVMLPAHTARTFGVEETLGRFVDAAYAYRFGPPGHDLIAAGLYAPSSEFPLAQCFHFPVGRPIERIPVPAMGMTGQARVRSNGVVEVLLDCRRFAWGVKTVVPGYLADDAYFSVEPGGTRKVVLTPVDGEGPVSRVWVTAVNAEGRLPIPIEMA